MRLLLTSSIVSLLNGIQFCIDPTTAFTFSKDQGQISFSCLNRKVCLANILAYKQEMTGVPVAAMVTV